MGGLILRIKVVPICKLLFGTCSYYRGVLNFGFILHMWFLWLYIPVPCNRTELDPATVFKVLVGTMSYRWFDLFKAVGMSYDALVEIKERFPYDAEISLFEAITEWLKGEGPKPSWKSLADTLSYEMLESKLANEITEKHFSEDDYAEAELLRKDGNGH